MPSSTAGKQRSLVEPMGLAFMAIAIGVALALLYPGKELTQDITKLESPDNVSLAYLKAMVAKDSEDKTLGLRLARNLLAMGEIKEAEKTLKPLLQGSGNEAMQARLIKLDIQIVQEENPEVVAELYIRKASVDKNDPSRWLAKAAVLYLGMEQPKRAGQLYAQASRKERKGEKAKEYSIEALDSMLAANKGAEAVEMVQEFLVRFPKDMELLDRGVAIALGQEKLLMAREWGRRRLDLTPDNKEAMRYQMGLEMAFADLSEAIKLVSGFIDRFPEDVDILEKGIETALAGEKLELARDWGRRVVVLRPDDKEKVLRQLEIEMALGDSETAITLIAGYIDRFPEDLDYLNEGVSVALAGNALDKAVAWGRKLLAFNPIDPVVIQRQIEVELAANETQAAFELAELLAKIDPENLATRKQLGRVAGWAGEAAAALEQKAWEARKDPQSPVLDEAIILAKQIYDGKTYSEMLELKADHRTVADEDILLLSTALEAQGDPERAIRNLKKYLKKNPKSRIVWETMAGIQERKGSLNAALKTWESISRLFGKGVQDVMKRAELHWRLWETDEALKIVRSLKDKAGPANDRYWKLYSDLAWKKENYEESMQASNVLWESSDKKDDEILANRLLLSAQQLGRNEEVMKVGEKAWLRINNPNMLLIAIDAASRGGLWEDMARLLEMAEKDEQLFQEFEGYWILKSQFFVERGYMEEAMECYEQALSLNPDSAGVRAGLLWLLMDQGEDSELIKYLNKWWTVAQNDPNLWSVYASALFKLDMIKESLPWFERYFRANPNDHLAYFGYADALERMGMGTQADTLRRHAFINLRSKAVSAMGRPSLKTNRDLLKMYIALVNDYEGPEAAEQWLRPFLKQGKGDPAVRDLAVTMYFTQDRIEHARYWMHRQDLNQIKTPQWQGVAMAIRDRDADMLSDIFKVSEKEMTVLNKAEMYQQLGRTEEALSHALDNIEP